MEASKYYLHRESIITAAQLYEEEGNAGAGITRSRGFYVTPAPGGEEELLAQKKSGSRSSVGRGFVTAMALQCICLSRKHMSGRFPLAREKPHASVDYVLTCLLIELKI